VAEPESPHLFPRAQERHRVFGGLLNDRQEHIFTWITVVIVMLYVTGWIGAIHDVIEQRREIARMAKEAGVKLPPPPPVLPAQQIATQIFQPQAPTTAFIDDAMLGFLNPLRGRSGKVFFTTVTPGGPIVSGAPGGTKSVLTGISDKVASDFTAPEQPGVYKLAVQLNQAMRQLDDFSVITLVPFSQKQGGHIGTYYLGSWPFEKGGTPKTPAYANPTGFIEVTQANADTPISAHFRLRDFLTKDQPNVWPKYLLLNPKLLDKLELTIQELEASGHPVKRFRIMSGFRTPEYNHGGGNTQGRANLSRHMYGDASDTFVDNDGNGSMDDLNHDGRVDVRDAEVVGQAVERVESKNPSLVGGVGVYSACCGHGPFTHVDVRGYRARWRGTGSG
jgi:uncharacterized protein YcbK (DUF882 family)